MNSDDGIDYGIGVAGTYSGSDDFLSITEANAQTLPVALILSVPLSMLPKPLKLPMMDSFGASEYGIGAPAAPVIGSSSVMVAVTGTLDRFTSPMFVR